MTAIHLHAHLDLSPFILPQYPEDLLTKIGQIRARIQYWLAHQLPPCSPLSRCIFAHPLGHTDNSFRPPPFLVFASSVNTLPLTLASASPTPSPFQFQLNCPLPQQHSTDPLLGMFHTLHFPFTTSIATYNFIFVSCPLLPAEEKLLEGRESVLPTTV